MQARWVVEAVDIAGDGGVRIGLGVIHAGDFLVLERGKEALGHCVVPAVAFAAHARHDTVRAYRLAERFAGVLAAAIGVEQHAFLHGTGRH